MNTLGSSTETEGSNLASAVSGAPVANSDGSLTGVLTIGVTPPLSEQIEADIEMLREDGSAEFILELAKIAHDHATQAVSEATQELVEEVAYLRERIAALERAKVIDEVAQDLALTQREQFRRLATDVLFVEAADFKQKLAIIKERHFPKQRLKRSRTDLLEPSDVVEEHREPTTPEMRMYVDALTRIGR